MLPEDLAEVGRLWLVEPHDRVLNRVAEDVSNGEIGSPILRALAARMLNIAGGLSAENPRVKFVGLAAPQIGVSIRLIIVDLAYNGIDRDVPPSLHVFLNPRIVFSSAETVLRREGCYSTGKINGLVTRHERITLEAIDIDGNPLSLNCAGMTARVFQHEIDHLDGIRFPDRITRDDHLHWVDTSGNAPSYRENSEKWACLCPRDRWLAMKAGTDWVDEAS